MEEGRVMEKQENGGKLGFSIGEKESANKERTSS